MNEKNRLSNSAYRPEKQRKPAEKDQVTPQTELHRQDPPIEPDEADDIDLPAIHTFWGE